jgi:hypothetical protein
MKLLPIGVGVSRQIAKHRANVTFTSALAGDALDKFSQQPRLIARFARERGLEPSEFNRLIRVARAFTCFQLVELVRRVPKMLATWPADVLIVTALPDLFFDDDVRDREARASFEHALESLRALASLALSIAIFSDATSFKTRRRDFFEKLRNQADYVVKVEAGPENKLSFIREKYKPLLSV